MTNRAEFERLLDVYGFRCERFGQDLSTHARAQVVSAFAALASAPVAGHQPYPATPEPDVIHSSEQENSYSRSAMEAAMRASHDRGYSVGWDHGREHAHAPVACNCPGGNKPADLHAPNCPVRESKAKLLDPYDGGTWETSAPVAGEATANTGDLPVWWRQFMNELTLRSEDEVRNDLPGILEICALDAIGNAAPLASEAECSCPSGDGSLRHPCAVHPAGDAVRTQALAALESARRFIRNGVEFGYIRMPDADTPDPAHRTPGLIEAAIRALSAQPGAQNDEA